MNCHHCNSDELILSLRQELSTKNHQLERLELDLQTLNQKYVAEIERVGNIQHEKDMVEHELEELSRKLFEEANAMVSIEKRARWQIENELRQTQERLLAEQTQLHELRLKLTTADDETDELLLLSDTHSSRKKKSYHNLRAQMDLEELHGLKRVSANHVMKYSSPTVKKQEQRTISMPPTPSSSADQKKSKKAPSTIDGVQLEAFKEYNLASSKQLLTPKKLNQTNFMKHCLTEDIEPCLRFGPQSKLSIKKMIDHLSRQPCFIEHITSFSSKPTQPLPQTSAGSKPLWERFNSSSTKSIIVSNACSACGRSSDPANDQSVLLNYRFRLDEGDSWLPIDQYCRDRLVAVCEFFVFIRNIQMGLYADRTIEDLYTENIRLRLQMFYSRMGALPVVMDDLGLDPNQVGKATQPTTLNEEEGDYYLSDDGSVSTGPNTPEPHSVSPLPMNTAWTLESSNAKTQ